MSWDNEGGFASFQVHVQQTYVVQVEAGNHGKIVAINIETGDFEVDANEILACDRLEARNLDSSNLDCPNWFPSCSSIWRTHEEICLITGIVNADFEPIIPLSVWGYDGKVYIQNAIIDTGFNGWLSLPSDLIAQLNLRWKRRGRAILGDGSECVFNIYEAVVVWDGDLLTIPVDEADSEPLVGMSLMGGYQLIAQVFKGGCVELSKVNAV